MLHCHESDAYEEYTGRPRKEEGRTTEVLAPAQNFWLKISGSKCWMDCSVWCSPQYENCLKNEFLLVLQPLPTLALIHSYKTELDPNNCHRTKRSYIKLLEFNVVFFFSFSGWGETESTWYVGHCWPIVPASNDRWWLWSSWRNEDWQGKPKYSEKTCPSATLSTTNPTWPDLGSNPGRRGGKAATNRLSYGTAKV
jgi:hypothetical protein